MTRIALLLGASGRFGRACATAFEARGWQLRRFDRQRDDLMRSARGADVIVNGWNPPYGDWPRLLPELHGQVIAAAARRDVPVILPGNVYVFGPATPPPWSETSAHAATHPLGRARIRMEAAYHAAGVPVILLRAGDFLDTRASGNWFDALMTRGLERGVLRYPGPVDCPHAWAFLPDLARATEALAARSDAFDGFTDIPFPGLAPSGTEMAAALARVLGRPVRLRPVPWGLLRLAAPVWPTARGLVELRYLWNTPHWLDDRRFRALLPGLVPTPLDAALAAALPERLRA
ncbi:epimerase [Pseudooceanicola sp. CBS1P-1]|uniref:Epimerase n=1 Tax=Pseudooceanicola albus TaxID=2692189 RepID=A0A6L7G577_9RHOB|nr:MULTISPECIES: epimerase [Pseudooceanicola]MBT9385152.1 epimerase [Pseudooceanicola endophyticus]MXN18556.1 epimerase [Pseudooceanicola albus]